MSLTAPGVGLAAAVPPGGYTRISSTSTSSGIVASVAALILSRFPHLTAAQVGRALTGGTTAPGPAGPAVRRRARHHRRGPGGGPGRHHQRGASRDPARRGPPRRARPKPERLSTPRRTGPAPAPWPARWCAYAVAGLCVLIVLLGGRCSWWCAPAERAGRPRRNGPAGPSPRAARAAQARARGLRAGPRIRPGPAQAGPAPAGLRAPPWTGGRGPPPRAGQLPGAVKAAAWARCSPPPAAPSRPVMTPAPKAGQGGQGGRGLRGAALGARTGARAHVRVAARRWRTARSRRIRVPSIRVPGDMAALPTVPPRRHAARAVRVRGRTPTPTFRRGPLAREGDDSDLKPARPLPTPGGRASASRPPRAPSTPRHRRQADSPCRHGSRPGPQRRYGAVRRVRRGRPVRRVTDRPR